MYFSTRRLKRVVSREKVEQTLSKFEEATHFKPGFCYRGVNFVLWKIYVDAKRKTARFEQTLGLKSPP